MDGWMPDCLALQCLATSQAPPRASTASYLYLLLPPTCTLSVPKVLLLSRLCLDEVLIEIPPTAHGLLLLHPSHPPHHYHHHHRRRVARMFAAAHRYIYITPPNEAAAIADANQPAAILQTSAADDGHNKIPPAHLTILRSLPQAWQLPPPPPPHWYSYHGHQTNQGRPLCAPAGEAVNLAVSGHGQYNIGGGQQHGYDSHGRSWPREQQQRPQAVASLPSAIQHTAYDGGDCHADRYGNLYATTHFQPTPFDYSYLAADVTTRSANSHLSANAQAHVPTQNATSADISIPDQLQPIGRLPRYPLRSAGPAKKLSKKQKAAARAAEQSTRGRASPVYELGAQPPTSVAPDTSQQIFLPKSLRPAQTQRSTTPGQSPPPYIKSNINAPRRKVMARPSPTPFYTYLASQQPQLLTMPRPLLVVLDLNGTLLKRSKFSGANTFVPRPYVQEFLTYIFANHNVMIWSSARPENVATMCSDLFTPQQLEQLVAVWARDRLGLSKEAYNAKVQVYKQLSLIWNDATIQAANRNKDQMWTQANTVLVDDSIDKSASEPYNLVEVEEFRNQPQQVKSDDYLKAVIEYLKVLSYQADVSAYIRSQPFRHECGSEFVDTSAEQGSTTFKG